MTTFTRNDKAMLFNVSIQLWVVFKKSPPWIRRGWGGFYYILSKPLHPPLTKGEDLKTVTDGLPT
jgi:hypothetical protein